MPSKSKSQQRLFGIVHKCQNEDDKKGICKSPKIRKLSKSVSKKDAKDFASTKHDDLPEKVEETKAHRSFKYWIESDLSENRIRTGLKFGYPDGYYRFQYPDLYSTPTSATAALDLENEKNMPAQKRENKNGLPDLVKTPKGMQSFPENVSFYNWLQQRLIEDKGESMEDNKCECECEACKKGDCANCSCDDCACEGCECDEN